MSKQEQYRQIAKNTAVIGGAQIIQMLVMLIRTKFVAMLLGPYGMGVNTLILSAISTIQQLSSLGIYQSGVRDLSQANALENKVEIAKLRKSFGWLTLCCGILGGSICLILSPILSLVLFGDYSYTKSFIVVAVALFFIALQNGKATIMQATQNLALLAKSTIYGAVLNLLLTTPIFYFWKINGIVPSIIVSYAVFGLVNKYFENKIQFITVPKLTRIDIIIRSKPILKLGWVLMMSNLLMVSFTFLLNAFISNKGSVNDVGLFQATSAICLQSMVIINTTLSSDYFPRLSAVRNDNLKIKNIVNQQVEIMLYIIVIISSLLIFCAPLVIKILLSKNFLPVVPLLQIMSLSFTFRIIWMILGMVMLAKGDKKNYFLFDAIIGNGMVFIINIVSYYFWELNGLGYSYLAGSIIMMFILSSVLRIKYTLSLNKNTLILFIKLMLMLVFEYLSFVYIINPISTFVSGLFTIYTCIYCVYKLNSILQFKQLILSYIKK